MMKYLRTVWVPCVGVALAFVGSIPSPSSSAAALVGGSGCACSASTTASCPPKNAMVTCPTTYTYYDCATVTSGATGTCQAPTLNQQMPVNLGGSGISETGCTTPPGGLGGGTSVTDINCMTPRNLVCR